MSLLFEDWWWWWWSWCLSWPTGIAGSSERPVRIGAGGFLLRAPNPPAVEVARGKCDVAVVDTGVGPPLLLLSLRALLGNEPNGGVCGSGPCAKDGRWGGGLARFIVSEGSNEGAVSCWWSTCGLWCPAPRLGMLLELSDRVCDDRDDNEECCLW